MSREIAAAWLMAAIAAAVLLLLSLAGDAGWHLAPPAPTEMLWPEDRSEPLVVPSI
jgi:hypothetical protein